MPGKNQFAARWRLQRREKKKDAAPKKKETQSWKEKGGARVAVTRTPGRLAKAEPALPNPSRCRY